MHNKNSQLSMIFEILMFTFIYLISDKNPFSLIFCGFSILIFGVGLNLYLSQNLTDNNLLKLMMLVVITATPHVLFIRSAASLLCFIFSLIMIFVLIKLRNS